MTITQELQSLLTPPKVELSPPPEIGQQAPSHPALKIPQPGGKPVVIAFLRHCGCPFAEKTLLGLRAAAAKHPGIAFVAVSHSTAPHTAQWLQAVGGGGAGGSNVEVVVDAARTVYAAWGLGVASFWHVLSPRGMYAAYRLATDEGIANRPTESGYRWQTGGAWAVDARGTVVWGRGAAAADEIPDFEEAVRAVEKSTVVRASL